MPGNKNKKLIPNRGQKCLSIKNVEKNNGGFPTPVDRERERKETESDRLQSSTST